MVRSIRFAIGALVLTKATTAAQENHSTATFELIGGKQPGAYVVTPRPNTECFLASDSSGRREVTINGYTAAHVSSMITIVVRTKPQAEIPNSGLINVLIGRPTPTDHGTLWEMKPVPTVGSEHAEATITDFGDSLSTAFSGVNRDGVQVKGVIACRNIKRS